MPGREEDSSTPREGTARTRPATSRDRAVAQQRRPATVRRSGRGTGQRATARTLGMHGLLGLASTRRAAVLALVVCALVLSVAVPLRNYLGQRSMLENTVQRQDTLRLQVNELEKQRSQLLDPAQVEVEARKRLGYVRPGETPYVVQPSSPPPATAQPDQPGYAAGDQWYGQMWESIAEQGGGR